MVPLSSHANRSGRFRRRRASEGAARRFFVGRVVSRRIGDEDLVHVLAKRIVESLDELSASEIEALWVEEAEYCLDELEQGVVTESPAEDVLRRARAAIS